MFSPRKIAPLVSLLALSACQEQRAGQRQLVTVARGDLVFERNYYGELEARKSIAIHAPELAGVWQLTVASVKDDGTRVKKGDVVLTFDKTIFEDELQELENSLAVAKAELRKVVEAHRRERVDLQLAVQRAKLTVDRAKLDVITGVNLISKLELEKAKITLQKAKLDHALAKKALRSFAKKRAAAVEVQRLKVRAADEKAVEKRRQVTASEIHAPASGVLYAPYTRLNWVRGKVAAGSVVRPGDKLLELPNLESFNAEIYVRQRDATVLQEGDSARVYATVLPGKAIEAKVLKKESFATTRNERIRSRNENPAGNLKEIKVVLELARSFPEMRPGSTIRAEIRTTIAKGVLYLPLAVLIDKPGGGHRVRLADGSERALKIGKTTSVHAEIIAGLGEGDRVLVPQTAADVPSKTARPKREGAAPAGARKRGPRARKRGRGKPKKRRH